mgnify:CR=1 FL=1
MGGKPKLETPFLVVIGKCKRCGKPIFLAIYKQRKNEREFWLNQKRKGFTGGICNNCIEGSNWKPIKSSRKIPKAKYRIELCKIGG